ncbi:MAG: hypothetical protein KJ556_09020 [Gammaproteobacteria bacterium]|nr:hypothetical protein [Gammaproteobacteria bacterium]MBU2059366.1 hypothetical protein [Gammaproteobacteria bacterium]MBU2175254.1 hypothetical protein [Gammaproteobacteria bacterium]MBU2247462.1 hypothetical protein [Gammaproteobacteria bacterium]MBU2346271.1 hypothetical protein [Gammaproteobacteria bacterium]
MSKWSVQEQENSVKAAAFSSAFISWISILWFLDEITLLWFKSETANDLLLLGYLPCLYYIFRQMKNHPTVLNHGWRLAEWYGNYLDEYLRSRFQRATTMAFHMMLTVALLGVVLPDLLLKFGLDHFLSFKLFSIVTLFVGSLSFYLNIRTVFNEQDDTEQDAN